MRIKDSHGKVWEIRREPSIFVSRKGKEDVRILKQNQDWGGRGPDNKLYRTVAVLDALSGETLRDYEQLPAEITLPLLKQWGFIGAKS